MSLAKHYKTNLDTLVRAAKNGDLAVLEVYDTESKRVRAAVVAISQEDGEHIMTPFALMVDGDPYETLCPPDPDKPGVFLNDKGGSFRP